MSFHSTDASVVGEDQDQPLDRVAVALAQVQIAMAPPALFEDIDEDDPSDVHTKLGRCAVKFLPNDIEFWFFQLETACHGFCWY